MKKRSLTRVVGQVVLAAMPTLALTTACRLTGEATYVVRSDGRGCHDACATLEGNGDEGSWRVADVMDCVEATEVEPAAASTDVTPEPSQVSTPVAVCRMRTRYMGGVGRRPEGLIVHEAEGRTEAGAFFARMEQLERAAVIAFERTARVLRAHGAPGHLVRDVLRARRDEERHVVLASRWRARFGGEPASIDAPRSETPPLQTLARENAIEGCVHETWGAVLAHAHAMSAGACEASFAASLAHDLRAIALDEASHAALSHRLDAWLRASLWPHALHALDRARRDAIEEVRASLDDDHDALVAIGWPSREARARLFTAAVDRLGWRAAA